MSLNPIRLCSQALVKIGANAITSLEEETAEARVAKQLYPLVRDGLLACYPWRFALMQKRLNRLLEKPVADYTYAYQRRMICCALFPPARASAAKVLIIASCAINCTQMCRRLF